MKDAALRGDRFATSVRPAAPRPGSRALLTRRRGASTPFIPVVLLSLLLALGLRAAGLGWGLPQPGRNYPYHPDEPILALAALQVDFSSMQLSPRFFNYGSLSIYLDRLAVDAAASAGWIRLSANTPEERARTLGSVILVGRWLSVLAGVLTVVATAALGARLFGDRTGALAALLLALAPLHLSQGHYNTVDVPAALWTTLCLLLCAGALQAPGRGAIVTAGVCAGLAASTKYNAGLVLLAPFFTLAATWRRDEWYASDRAAALIFTPLAGAGAFLVTTPGIVIDTARFLEAVRYELAHTASGHGLVFVATPPAWLYHLTHSLPDGLGFPLALTASAGVGGAILDFGFWILDCRRISPQSKIQNPKSKVGSGLLLAFVVPYYLLIGTAEVKFARYLLPILPALLVLAARLLVGEEDGSGVQAFRCSGVQDEPAKRSVNGHPGTIGLRAAAVVVVLLWTGAYGVAMAAVYTRPDPRDQAADWIASTRRRGEHVALAGEPWFYSPPLVSSIGCAHQPLTNICGQPLPAWIMAPAPRQGALELAELARVRPPFVVMSEFEYADPLRLRARTGHSDRMTALVEGLSGSYRLARVFRGRPELGPFRWFTRRPPVHDLLYPMPDVRVYQLDPTQKPAAR